MDEFGNWNQFINVVQRKIPKIHIDRERIKEFLKTDRGILLISMGVALTFWLMIKLSQPYESNRVVALDYTLPESKSFVQIPPSKMKATLEGVGWDLMYDFFWGAPCEITLNLTEQPHQSINNAIIKSKIVARLASTQVKVAGVEYDYIEIFLENKKSKKVAVSLRTDLKFAPEFRLKTAVAVQPDSVEVSGPESFLTTLENWPTTLLSLEGLNASFARMLPLQSPTLEQVTIDPTQVEVQAAIEQYTGKSLFVPVSVINAPDSLNIFPDKIKVSFVVGLSQYNIITSDSFLIIADLKGISLNETNNAVPLTMLKQPKAASTIHFSPQAVEFLYVKEETPDSL